MQPLRKHPRSTVAVLRGPVLLPGIAGRPLGSRGELAVPGIVRAGAGREGEGPRAGRCAAVVAAAGRDAARTVRHGTAGDRGGTDVDPAVRQACADNELGIVYFTPHISGVFHFWEGGNQDGGHGCSKRSMIWLGDRVMRNSAGSLGLRRGTRRPASSAGTLPIGNRSGWRGSSTSRAAISIRGTICRRRAASPECRSWRSTASWKRTDRGRIRPEFGRKPSGCSCGMISRSSGPRTPTI